MPDTLLIVVGFSFAYLHVAARIDEALSCESCSQRVCLPI